MTAGELFVQMPPDPFNGIRVRGRRGWVVQLDALPPAFELLLHGVALMTAGIVTHNVNLAVAEQATA